jgi:hypothetical protein
MKSVLMIAYYFPPDGSAGAYRPLRFVRQLSKMGWRTSVISADPYQHERYDPGLLYLVPMETDIVRVRGRDPWQAIQTWRRQLAQKRLSDVSNSVKEEIFALHHKPFRSRIRKIVNSAEAWYYNPDTARFWIKPAIEATLKLCTHKRQHAIWATAGPISAWLVAHQVSRHTGVPYVLDLRDPHGLGYYDWELQWPKWINRKFRNSIHQVLAGSQAVVFLFDSVAECYYRAFPGALDPAKIHIIPNGFERMTEDSPIPNGSSCKLLYTGNMATYHYDTLLQAIVLLLRPVNCA